MRVRQPLIARGLRRPLILQIREQHQGLRFREHVRTKITELALHVDHQRFSQYLEIVRLHGYFPDRTTNSAVHQSVAPEAEASLPAVQDRKSTRLNSSHLGNSYAVFCVKKK